MTIWTTFNSRLAGGPGYRTIWTTFNSRLAGGAGYKDTRQYGPPSIASFVPVFNFSVAQLDLECFSKTWENFSAFLPVFK